jgi:DNA invertase Pin-like site-specific DNA recombinase
VNQQQNCQGAIDKYKARIAEIAHALAQPLAGVDHLGRPYRASASSRLREREKQLHLERMVADLEAQLSRMNQPERTEAASEAGARLGNRKEPRSLALKNAQRAVKDSVKYPTMTAEEVMAKLHLSKSAVYEHPKLERAPTGTRSVRYTTKSVIAVLESNPE